MFRFGIFCYFLLKLIKCLQNNMESSLSAGWGAVSGADSAVTGTNCVCGCVCLKAQTHTN